MPIKESKRACHVSIDSACKMKYSEALDATA